MKSPRILIIYTGGTIGMVQDEKTGRLRPFKLKRVSHSIPSIRKLGIEIEAVEFDEVIDSSQVTTEHWIMLAKMIQDHYNEFDGFVVLHGSDTMAYSASALSFLLENLGKPVIFTGSQLPIGLPRTDARENLITALEIAALRDREGRSLIPEVCIYFEDQLYRGNRSHKFNSENFDAFLSLNYPILAEVGVRIRIFEERLLSHNDHPLLVHQKMNGAVALLQLFPGMNLEPYADMFVKHGTEALILQTYGSGNAPSDTRFLGALEKMLKAGVMVVNVTQCREGHVEMGKYESSKELLNLGVVSGDDITVEAAVTKAMFVLAQTEDRAERVTLMTNPLRGEMGV